LNILLSLLLQSVLAFFKLYKSQPKSDENSDKNKLFMIHITKKPVFLKPTVMIIFALNLMC